MDSKRKSSAAAFRPFCGPRKRTSRPRPPIDPTIAGHPPGAGYLGPLLGGPAHAPRGLAKPRPGGRAAGRPSVAVGSRGPRGFAPEVNQGFLLG